MKLTFKFILSFTVFFQFVTIVNVTANSTQEHHPIWKEITEKRPIPKWFQDAKLGIFVHWGPYSVPAYSKKGTYAEWYGSYFSRLKEVSNYHKKIYNNTPYRNFAKDFKAQNFDAKNWAKLFKRSGASYAVLTTKHHDGFSLWDAPKSSKVRGYPWNSTEVGAKRNLVEEFTTAMRQENIKVGFYHSILEWNFEGDKRKLYQNNIRAYVDEVLHPSLKDLVVKYKPDLLWGDGQWEKKDKDIRSYEFINWLYNDSPVKNSVVINDRWFSDSRFRYGMYATPEYGFSGKSIPNYKLKYWEECRGIGHSFGYNQVEDYKEYKTREELIHLFLKIVGAGGKLLLNVGPTASGTIPTIMEDRLVALGNFIKLYSNAIHKTKPAPLPLLIKSDGTAVQIDEKNIYYFLFQWPKNKKLVLPMMSRFKCEKVTIYQENKRINERGEITTLPFKAKSIPFNEKGENVIINLENKTPLEYATVFHVRFKKNIKKFTKEEVVAISPSFLNGKSRFVLNPLNILKLKNGVIAEKYFYNEKVKKKLFRLTKKKQEKKVVNIGGWKRGGYVQYILKEETKKRKSYQLSIVYSRLKMEEKLSLSVSFLDAKKNIIEENKYSLPDTNDWADFKYHSFKGVVIPKKTRYITFTPMKNNNKITYLMNLADIIFTEE